MGDAKGVSSGRVWKGFIGVLLALILFGSGCKLTYLIHAAAGQFRLITDSIPMN